MAKRKADAMGDNGSPAAKKNKKRAPPKLEEDEQGRLWTQDTPDNQWARAVCLDFVRQTGNLKVNEYKHTPQKSTHALDVTALNRPQRNWGPKRQHLPDVLFQYQRRGRPIHDSGDVQLKTLIVGGVPHYVLDSEGYPIREFSILPLTLSTKLEGFRIEAYKRLDDRITLKDLRARMMAVPNKAGQLAVPGENVLNMRAVRFRRKYRCIFWGNGNGDQPWRDVHRHEMTPAMVQANTTRHLVPLGKKKMVYLEQALYGTQFSRAGPQQLSENKRHASWFQRFVLTDLGYPVTEDEYELTTRNIRGVEFQMARRRYPEGPDAQKVREAQDKVDAWPDTDGEDAEEGDSEEDGIGDDEPSDENADDENWELEEAVESLPQDYQAQFSTTNNLSSQDFPRFASQDGMTMPLQAETSMSPQHENSMPQHLPNSMLSQFPIIMPPQPGNSMPSQIPTSTAIERFREAMPIDSGLFDSSQAGPAPMQPSHGHQQGLGQTLQSAGRRQVYLAQDRQQALGPSWQAPSSHIRQIRAYPNSTQPVGPDTLPLTSSRRLTAVPPTADTGTAETGNPPSRDAVPFPGGQYIREVTPGCDYPDPLLFGAPIYEEPLVCWNYHSINSPVNRRPYSGLHPSLPANFCKVCRGTVLHDLRVIHEGHNLAESREDHLAKKRRVTRESVRHDQPGLGFSTKSRGTQHQNRGGKRGRPSKASQALRQSSVFVHDDKENSPSPNQNDAGSKVSNAVASPTRRSLRLRDN